MAAGAVQLTPRTGLSRAAREREVDFVKTGLRYALALLYYAAVAAAQEAGVPQPGRTLRLQLTIR